VTVRNAKSQAQFPRSLESDHTRLLEKVLPEDRHGFDRVIAEIRTNVSEWLWTNVLTKKAVSETVETLANYFLLRNGEFGLSLIREIERLKISRLTARNISRSGIIREQDLQLALLRASLGTSAQSDPSFSHLRMSLPTGPLRPLLPSLSHPNISAIKPMQVNFNDVLLGTPLTLLYTLHWPLDLFLQASDLQTYADLFSYISSLRKVHTRVLECWTWLSNAQRARRKWTGLGEGGTEKDSEGRKVLLRCGWGLVRDMSWFLDTLLAYIMTDVIDVEFRKLKSLLGIKVGGGGPGRTRRSSIGSTKGGPDSGQGGPPPPSARAQASAVQTVNPQLDFTTLRAHHTRYLQTLLFASLLASPACATTIRTILEVCERFVAQVERWGGDVLPALLFEGSMADSGRDDVGHMVRERWKVVHNVNEVLLRISQVRKPG
jgi:gamma-tubulin complex component 4